MRCFGWGGRGLGNNVTMDLIDSARIKNYENGKETLGVQCDDNILQDCGFGRFATGV